MRPVTRQIARAIALIGSSQGLGLLCSLVRNKLVALWVGPAGIALLGILNTAVEMISSLSQQGLRTSSVSEIAKASDTTSLPRISATVISCGKIVGIASAIVMLFASPFLSRLSFGDYSHAWTFAVLSSAVLLNSYTASRQAIAQGEGRLARLAKASLIGSVAGMIISIPLIYFLRMQGLVWVIVGYSVATATAFYFPRITLPKVALGEALSQGRTLIRMGMWLTLSSALTWAISYLFISWLNNDDSGTAAGLYQSGYTVSIRYIGILFSAIAMEFYPRLAQRITRGPRHSGLMISHETGMLLRIAVPAVALLMITAPWVMRLLYSSDFEAAIPFLTGALAATPLRALSWCAAFVIIAKNDGKIFLFTETASGIICLGLSICLYTLRGLEGLGDAYVIWYLVYAGMILAVCRKRYGITVKPAIIIATILSTVGLLLIRLI